MTVEWKVSTAMSFMLWFADSADGKTGKTGLTISPTLAKYGDTSFSSISPVITEVGGGHYKEDLTTTHMNTPGLMSQRATATGADACDLPNFCNVIAVDKQDAVRMGLTSLPNVASGSAGAIPTTGTGANQIAVDGAGNVKADVNKWVTGTPNALVSGRVDSSTGAMASGVVTATAIAANAITAAKIATDAIGAAQLAADAVTEIQSGLATSSALATVQADTDDIQARLPAALVGGKMDSHVNDIAASAITATSIASSAITNAKFAAGALDAAAIADGAIDRATFAQDAKDMFGEARRNTAQAGASTTITLDASASSLDDRFKNGLIFLVGGTGSGQFRTVTGYVGSTKVLTVDRAWDTTPDNTTVFEIFMAGGGGTSSGGGGTGDTTGTAIWDKNETLARKRRVDLIIRADSGDLADRGTDFMALGIVYLSQANSTDLAAAAGTMTNKRIPVNAPTFTFTADLTTDKLAHTAHGLVTGQGPIFVSNSGGGLPGGLAVSTGYYVIVIDDDHFKVATSIANAYAGTAIDITSNGTGTQSVVASISPPVTCSIGVHGLFTYEATQAETNRDDNEILLLVDGSGYSLDNNAGGRASIVMNPNDGWDGMLGDGITRNQGLLAAARDALAPIPKIGNDYIVRDINDTKDSHHGTITAAGRSGTGIDDLT